MTGSGVVEFTSRAGNTAGGFGTGSSSIRFVDLNATS